MNTDKYKLQLLRNAVEDVFGRTPWSPTDFNNLSYEILINTKNKIGVSTLKRFWGYVKSTHSATYTTLSVLARYAGYRDWDVFCAQYKNDKDSDFSSVRLLIATNLNLKSVVHAEWSPKKWLSIKKIDHPSRFEVLESNNIKLLPGDIVNIDTFIVGEKFIATDCCRGGVDLGTYIGARSEGIASIKIIDLGSTIES